MKAVVVREFAPIEAARRENIDAAAPGPGEVAIDMRAAEVNFPDILVIEGKYQVKPPLPFSPGKAGAGVVAATGEGVTSISVGDHIAVQAEYGTYSEWLIAKADTCYPMPDGMPFEIAAALGLVYQTSHFALIERGGFQADETVLVLGASGGIGTAAVQLARAMGAKTVIGAVLGAGSAKVARDAGCDVTVDLRMDNLRDGLRDAVRQATGGAGVDVVIDPVGGEVTGAALRAMAWRGRLVVIGFAAGEIPTIKANYLLVKNITVSGLQWSDYRERDPEWVRRVQSDIFALWRQGKLSPIVSKTIRLSDFAKALNKLKEGKARGKIILLPGS